MFWAEFGLLAGPESPLDGWGSCEWLGKCGFGMLNQAGFWLVLGGIGCFWGGLWDGLDGRWAWTVGSVIRFLEVSRGIRRGNVIWSGRLYGGLRVSQGSIAGVLLLTLRPCTGPLRLRVPPSVCRARAWPRRPAAPPFHPGTAQTASRQA